MKRDYVQRSLFDDVADNAVAIHPHEETLKVVLSEMDVEKFKKYNLDNWTLKTMGFHTHGLVSVTMSWNMEKIQIS